MYRLYSTIIVLVVPCLYRVLRAVGDELWGVGQHVFNLATIQRNNFMGKDASGSSIVVGGYLFEYTDEWWKQGAPSSQEFGYVQSSVMPTGYFAEEFFGIFSIKRGAGIP
jgi:hypothetical protein